MKGLQKKECIEIFDGFLKINNKAKEFFRNINPKVFEKMLLHSITLIEKFLFL